VKLLSGGSVATGDFFETVPYENVGQLAILNVEINGVKARFLFDSGAPNVISPELAAKLNLKTASSTKVLDSGGNKGTQDIVVLDSAKVGKIYFFNTAAIVQDLRSNDALSCMNIDGIIGANLMKEAYWEIDFQAKNLKFSNKITNLTDTAKMAILPFKTQISGTPMVDLRLNGTLIKNMIFDTGSNGDITVPNSEVKKIPFTAKEKPMVSIYGSTSYGVYGASPMDTVYFRKIDSLQIGNNLHLNNKVVNFRGDTKIIGMHLFENYTVIMDWNSKQIYFKEVKPYVYDEVSHFGFGLAIDKNLASVGNLILKSDADGKLRIGDRILTINGDDLENANETFFCPFIYDDQIRKAYGDSLKLKVKRGEEIFEIEVAKELFLN